MCGGLCRYAEKAALTGSPGEDKHVWGVEFSAGRGQAAWDTLPGQREESSMEDTVARRLRGARQASGRRRSAKSGAMTPDAHVTV